MVINPTTNLASYNPSKTRCTRYNIMWKSFSVNFVVVFFPGPPVSSTNKTDRHDRTEILLKVAFNFITITMIILEDLNVIVRWNTSMNVMRWSRRGVIEMRPCFNLQNFWLPFVICNHFLSNIYIIRWFAMTVLSQIFESSWDSLSHVSLSRTHGRHMLFSRLFD